MAILEQTSDYYGELDSLIAQYKKILYNLESDRVDRENDISLFEDYVDYEESIHNISMMINSLKILRITHKFYKLSEAEFDQVMEELNEGVRTRKYVAAFKHTIHELETIQDIALLYGLDWTEILIFNNLKSYELYPGLEIDIPRESEPKELSEFVRNNPVFESHSGITAIGRDLPNILEAAPNGDLKVLGYRDTLNQSINNQILTQLDDNIGEDFPSSVRTEIIKARIGDIVVQDPRISGVELDKFEVEENNDGITIEPAFYLISGLSYEELKGDQTP